jgi:hypothetical protein
MSAATNALNVGTPALPFGAANIVLAVCEAKFDGVTASVPPSVIVPVDVIVPPVRVIPLTDPAVATLVTVPTLILPPKEVALPFIVILFDTVVALSNKTLLPAPPILMDVAEATPSVGVTSVGDDALTKLPIPVPVYSVDDR